MSKAYKIEGQFVAHRLDLLLSPAWQAAPRALKAMLEVIEIEHLRHKGSANGHLFVSYTQFAGAGMNRNTTAEMIVIGEALGLLRVNRATTVKAPRLQGNVRDASCYRLTYLPSGAGQEIPPSDEWKRIKTEEAAEMIVENNRKPKHNSMISKARRAA